MKFVIVSCSQRKESQSLKVARYLKSQLNTKVHEVFLFDCGETPLPLWGTDQADSSWSLWTELSTALTHAEAIILITPEWAGMATPQAKNLFLLAGQAELGHKAGLIVTVSAGRGGAYPIAEIRASSYKNTKINWIPEHLIIREVNAVLNQNEATQEADLWIKDRIDYALAHLEMYAEALTQIRDQLPHDSRFTNGM